MICSGGSFCLLLHYALRRCHIAVAACRQLHLFGASTVGKRCEEGVPCGCATGREEDVYGGGA